MSDKLPGPPIVIYTDKVRDFCGPCNTQVDLKRHVVMTEAETRDAFLARCQADEVESIYLGRCTVCDNIFFKR